MPLSKASYEKALGRPLTDDEYAKLSAASSAKGTQTSRDSSAYDGARLMTAPDRDGSKKPIDKGPPTPITMTSSVTGKPVTFKDEADMNANVYKVNGEFDQDAIAKARAERHGPGYTAPAPAPPSYSFPVQSKGSKGGTDAFLWSGTPGEIDAYVKSGHITPEQAAKLKAEIVPQTPLGSITTQPKAAPVYAPIPAAKPGGSPALPAAPAPVAAPAAPSMAAGATTTPDDDYAGAIAFARKKWGF